MFVRTKDGVYEELDTTEQGVWTTYGNFIENNEILNQSENLEDLCDCFVAVRKNASGTYSVFFIKLEDGKTWITWINSYDIYGAIWTDKGLIYVAKLNENGELELI